MFPSFTVNVVRIGVGVVVLGLVLFVVVVVGFGVVVEVVVGVAVVVVVVVGFGVLFVLVVVEAEISFYLYNICYRYKIQGMTVL